MPCSMILMLLALGLAVRANIQPWPSYQQRNYNTVKAIYNLTIYPNNQAFLERGERAIPEGLFHPDLIGRVTPVGNFTGIADNAEYFFGLTPPPRAPTYLTWTKADIVSFSSGCAEVASSVVYGTTTGVNASVPETYGKPITTIKQVAFWRFNDKGAVVAYDAWLPTLKEYTDELYGRTGAMNASAQSVSIKSLCGLTQKNCVGPNQVYASQEDCEAQLAKKPFGSFDKVFSDSVTCRSLHVLLTKLRPEHHCPHVGPTGGGKCIDVDYNSVYFDDEQLFGEPLGSTFSCPYVER